MELLNEKKISGDRLWIWNGGGNFTTNANCQNKRQLKTAMARKKLFAVLSLDVELIIYVQM